MVLMFKCQTSNIHQRLYDKKIIRMGKQTQKQTMTDQVHSLFYIILYFRFSCFSVCNWSHISCNIRAGNKTSKIIKYYVHGLVYYLFVIINTILVLYFVYNYWFQQCYYQLKTKTIYSWLYVHLVRQIWTDYRDLP